MPSLAIVATFCLDSGATASLFPDGDVMIETPINVTPGPYFVLSREDLTKLLSPTRVITKAKGLGVKPLTPQRESVAMPVVSNTSSAVKEILFEKLSVMGYPQDDAYVKIYEALHREREQSVSEMVDAAHLNGSRSSVADKLVHLEKCGFARIAKRAAGTATLWLKR